MNEQTAVWVRAFIGPAVAAALGAGSAYMAIREDLALTIHRVDTLTETSKDHEGRLREIERRKGQGQT